MATIDFGLDNFIADMERKLHNLLSEFKWEDSDWQNDEV